VGARRRRRARRRAGEGPDNDLGTCRRAAAAASVAPVVLTPHKRGRERAHAGGTGGERERKSERPRRLGRRENKMQGRRGFASEWLTTRTKLRIFF
jgi:hypothetical protein